MKKILINEQIRAQKVRLIDENGKQIGIFSLEEALKIAKKKGFDLIQVTEKLEIPVCKLGDYGKYLYQLQKKERKKGRAEGGLKNIRLSFNISLHDLQIKAEKVQKLIEKGNKVRIELKIKGREEKLINIGKEKINQFLKIVEGLVPIKIEKELTKQPRGLTMIISKK